MNNQPYPEKIYLPFILYPPAMQANPLGTDFALRNLDVAKSAGDYVLYLSIPFCKVRCRSCPYFISLLREDEKTDIENQYVNALITDIKKWSQYPRWKDGSLRSIYIGGGTGSILETDNIKKIVEAIFENLPVSADYSFTLEGNARDFTPEKLDYVARSQINRVSLGVQSFNEDMLKIIGSPHAAQESIKTISGLQERGFENIQFDMMYNLPGHSLKIWQDDLKVLKSLNVKHFTIYTYRIHKDTVQDKLIRKGKVSPIQDRESPMVKRMYTDAVKAAEDQGFNMYMFDHFAVPGYENQYNYWTFKEAVDALGIGAGAYSFINHYRTGSEKNVRGYIETINSGEHMITAVSEKMNLRVRKERYVIFAFQYFKIQYDEYYKKFQSSFLEDFTTEIQRIVEKDLAIIKDDCLEMTDLGKAWHMNVFLEFVNDDFWDDVTSVREPNWAMNIPMIDLVANSKERFLGIPNERVKEVV